MEVGAIVEVAYSQNRKRLYRLAESYLLDSDASVQVVVGLDIEYSKRGSRKATLSVWRAQVVGDELQVVEEVTDEVSCIRYCLTSGILTLAPGFSRR